MPTSLDAKLTSNTLAGLPSAKKRDVEANLALTSWNEVATRPKEFLLGARLNERCLRGEVGTNPTGR